MINVVINQSIKSSSREIAVFDMSTAILHNTFKTTTLMLNCQWNVLLLGDYRSLQFFHRVKFSSVIDLLLKGIINTVLRSGLFGGHISGLMKSTFSFSDSRLHCGPCELARRPAEVSICDDGILPGCHTTTGPFPGRLDSSSLGAVDLCASTELIRAKFEMLHI